jgi:Tfp pilus assembly protein PilO
MSNILKNNIIKLIIYIALAVALFVGVSVVFSSMKIKMSKVYEIKEKLASYQKNKKAFEDEVKEIRDLEERVKTLESFKISSENIPSLLSTLEKLANKHSISFEITSVQTPIENEKTKLLIETTSKGSFVQIQNFFEELQHQNFQVRLAKVFLFSEKGVSSSPEVTGTLSVKGAKTPTVSKELKWQGVATIEIQSF